MCSLTESLKMMPIDPLDSEDNYGATSTGCWWVGCYIWYSEEGPGWAAAPPSPLLAVPNVIAHPPMASVPITVLLYDGPLLCSFSVAIKGLTTKMENSCHYTCRLGSNRIGYWQLVSCCHWIAAVRLPNETTTIWAPALSNSAFTNLQYTENQLTNTSNNQTCTEIYHLKIYKS